MHPHRPCLRIAIDRTTGNGAMRMRWMVVAGAVCASLAQAAVAGDWQRRDADVRAADGQRVLYRESHFVRTQGTPERWVAYRCPDGRAFARKRVLGGGQAPAFALEDARGAYAEGVRGGTFPTLDNCFGVPKK